MTILGIDTSTRSGSIAVTRAGRVLGSLQVEGRLDHSEQLLSSISYLLSRLQVTRASLDAVAVSVGPGSFTGVRVGLASAGGLARALDIPALGMSSLEALARSVCGRRPGSWICPWLEAGRGEVYAAAYLDPGEEGGPRLLRGPSLARPDAWLEGLPAAPVRFLGDGASAYGEMLLQHRGSGCLEQPQGPWFLASTLAGWAERQLQRGSRAGSPVLEPLYLRPSDAELGRGKRG
jgi:tRNA threonylcarbamoyladenosine biosynthesis protein TsaB